MRSTTTNAKSPSLPVARAPESLRRAWIAAMPAAFVVLWSSGFVGAQLGLPHAEPFTFLLVRFVLVVALLSVLVLITRAPWPQDWRLAGHLAVSGALVHGLYLGGVYSAMRAGLPAALAALITGLQPILTAFVAGPALGERLSRRQWLGLVLGLLGVAMVLSTKLTGLRPEGFGWGALALVFAALIGITAGTLYQKRFCTGMDLRTGTLVQYVAALLFTLPNALLFETMEIEWTGEFVVALVWLVLVLSLGAISLLMTMIRLGGATRVSSLFYLTPPTTALMSWGLFGERLAPVGIAGMIVAATGVALVVARRP
jgi:drug/metabolite transporter (DMT)-like permease